MALDTDVRPVPGGVRGPGRRSRRARGRRLVVAALGLGLVLGLLGVVANLALVGRLERIEDAFAGLAERPAGAPGRTFLTIGTRPGGAGGPDVPWLAGEQSVEAVMLVDVAADGLSAQVETLPDSSGAVGASSRPSDTVASVESWSGRRVDHLVAVDWTTFVRLAEHNGVDPTYAYGSRPSVQHDFLRRVLEGALHQELRKHPLDLYRVLSTTVDGTAVDDDMSVLELDALAFSLRDLRSNDISFATARADRAGRSPN